MSLRTHKLAVALALIASMGGVGMRAPEPQREKDPAQDADRILAAEQKRARKAARRAARNKV